MFSVKEAHFGSVSNGFCSLNHYLHLINGLGWEVNQGTLLSSVAATEKA